MNADQPSGQAPASAANIQLAQWAELLAEMSALHAKLEYMHLMLRLGGNGAPPAR